MPTLPYLFIAILISFSFILFSIKSSASTLKSQGVSRSSILALAYVSFYSVILGLACYALNNQILENLNYSFKSFQQITASPERASTPELSKALAKVAFENVGELKSYKTDTGDIALYQPTKKQFQERELVVSAQALLHQFANYFRTWAWVFFALPLVSFTFGWIASPVAKQMRTK